MTKQFLIGSDYNQHLKDFSLSGKKLKVHTFPDPILKKIAKDVTPDEFGDHFSNQGQLQNQKCNESVEQNEDPNDLTTFCNNMLFTMYQAPGIGLAAPQVGVSKRILVMDIDFERNKNESNQDESKTNKYIYSNFNPFIFINPKIVKKDGETTYQEGCLSLPGVFEDIKRAKIIEVEFQDVKGNTHLVEMDGLLSICLQHEMDHLEGIVLLDRLGPVKRTYYAQKLMKLKRKK